MKKKHKRAPGGGRKKKFGEQPTVYLGAIRVPKTHRNDLRKLVYAELKKDKYQTPKE